MRVTWVQPEDLVRHELWQSASEGRDAAAIAEIRDRWAVAGGAVDPPYGGASAEIGTAEQRALAGELLQELGLLPDLTAGTEPSSWPEISAQLTDAADTGAAPTPWAPSEEFADKL
ncbi:MAG: ADP-ribosylglycohydrolase family protein, partial [Actinomycetota bacterium]|nr:ADP-ribosylglycohydrolase family protein [Actinomycetota bacterium]